MMQDSPYTEFFVQVKIIFLCTCNRTDKTETIIQRKSWIKA
jgi:hypothetical protein